MNSAWEVNIFSILLTKGRTIKYVFIISNFINNYKDEVTFYLINKKYFKHLLLILRPHIVYTNYEFKNTLNTIYYLHNNKYNYS